MTAKARRREEEGGDEKERDREVELRQGLTAKTQRRRDEEGGGNRGRWNDLHGAVGWMLEGSEGDLLVEDDWLVVGQTGERSGHRFVVHSWLVGQRSGRWVRVTRVSGSKRESVNLFVTGTLIVGVMRFFVGGILLVGEVEQLRGQRQAVELGVAVTTFGAFFEQYARELVLNPWVGQRPLLVEIGAVVQVGERWQIVDGEGVVAWLSAENNLGWHLMAAVGSPLFGLWDGRVFTPLGLWVNGRLLDVKLLRGVK